MDDDGRFELSPAAVVVLRDFIRYAQRMAAIWPNSQDGNAARAVLERHGRVVAMMSAGNTDGND